MYAKIVDNKITDLNAVDGGSGWVLVPADVEGADKIYDTGTSAVRAKTDAEIKAEFDAAVLADSWINLRQQRDIFLRDTDAHMASDRPATTNMPEYRAYLRDLPESYDDESILEQAPVMNFDDYVASL
tara:strand:- start:545 stop:928 length:384 start_codon:yes stop_codon:yes gene_type:complete